MPLGSRFPMYPEHALGFLYGRRDSVVVVWADDKSVEEAPGASASSEDLEAFARLLDAIRTRELPNTWAAVHNEILAGGWEDRGMLRYEVQSSVLLGDATSLRQISQELWRERERILDAGGGRHPEAGSQLWANW